MHLRRRVWPWAVFAWIAVTGLLGACASGGEPPAGPAAGSSSDTATAAATGAATARPGGVPVGGVRTDFSLGTCEATISGGVTGTIKSGGDGGAANSEYWLSEAELLQAGRQVGPDEATIRAKLAAKEFVFYPLILNCGDTRTGIVFQPSATRHEQFPFGPGTYRISAGSAQAPDGEVAAAASVNGSTYRVTGGTFAITQFDRTVLAGTFQMEIEEQRTSASPKSGMVTGRFEMKCSGAAPRREGCAR